MRACVRVGMDVGVSVTVGVIRKVTTERCPYDVRERMSMWCMAMCMVRYQMGVVVYFWASIVL